MILCLACFSRSTVATSSRLHRGSNWRDHCRYNHSVFDRRRRGHVPKTSAEHWERRVSINAHTFILNILFSFFISWMLFLSFNAPPFLHCWYGTRVRPAHSKHLSVFLIQRPTQTQAASSHEVRQLDGNGERFFPISHLSDSHIWHSLSTRRVSTSLHKIGMTYSTPGYARQLTQSRRKEPYA